MNAVLAQALMDHFADATGITGSNPPRRYLWTDAFAVCNFLGLFRQTGKERFLALARGLVEQVHHTLGRHRDDDPRQGWISGLPEDEGERHPTCGGLRIGKRLNERGPQQGTDERLEWDRDGQYFHYLTKWMHALYRMGQETGEEPYFRWAAELALVAHKAFTRELYPSGPRRIVWKMSIDLSRPLVSSTGQHDALDGLVMCLELQHAQGSRGGCDGDLTPAIAELTQMCEEGSWVTDDPLGMGGLFDAASRLGQLVFMHQVDADKLLRKTLLDAAASLQTLPRHPFYHRSAEHRLAFRELGLAIGMHGLQRASEEVEGDQDWSAACRDLCTFIPLAEQIERFWTMPEHRANRNWLDHHDINDVMLATSLMPESYLTM